MVDLSRTNYILGNVNALLGSTVGAVNDRNRGADWGTAGMNFGLNVLNGTVRNAVAYDMRKTTGSNLGFIINGLAGYGNEEANAKGTMGLMGASIMTSMLGGPFGGWYGGGWCGGGPFGGGMFGGGGLFGGGCCNHGYPGGFMGGGGFFPSSYTEINITTSGSRSHRHFWG